MFDIIVIGGTNIDIKAKADKAHLAGTSNPGVITFTPGGVARNIAHNLGLLGVNVALVSVIGTDAAGDIAASATQAAGVDMSLCLRSTAATGAYVAVLDEAGELVSAVNDMRILEELTPATVKSHIATLMVAKFVVVDCNVSLDLLEWLALHFGEKLIVEPVSVAKCQKLRTLLEKYEVFIATPNRDQLTALSDMADVGAACADLHERGLQNLVVHLGSEGAVVSAQEATRHFQGVAQSHVCDVTGAGDSAVAGLVYGLAKGYDIATAAQFGQAAASLVLNSTASTATGLTEAALQTIVKGANA